ncbi:hypothetical protein ACSBR2_038078 [Camellia fascicularis]
MDMDQKGPGKNKRMWTDEEDRELVYALFDMVNTVNHKADNDFKSGLLGVLEGVLHEKLPGCGIKAKPHIESRVKTLKTDTGSVFDMVNGVGCSGFGWDSNTNMVVAEKQVWDGYVQSHKRAAHWKIGVSHIVTCCASSSRKIVLREKMRLLLMMSWRKGAEMRALTHKI